MVAARRLTAPDHLRAMETTSALTRFFYEMYGPQMSVIHPKAVIDLLHNAKVKFILMGTHGISAWRKQPRATHDVDILVALKDHEKAVRIVHEGFPHLRVEVTPVVTRFIDPAVDDPVIDLMKPLQDLFRSVFRYSERVGKTHRVPDLEMALACKFAAMVSPYREADKKLVDGGDFVNIVKYRAKSINLRKLKKLAEMVYKGGGTEIAKMVADVKAGRRIQF